MRAFDFEIATQRISNALEGLTAEEKKNVLNHLLEHDETFGKLDPEARQLLAVELAKKGAVIAATSTADVTIMNTVFPKKSYIGSNAVAAVMRHQLQSTQEEASKLEERIEQLKADYNGKVGELNIVIDTLHQEGWSGEDISIALAKAGIVGAVHDLGSGGLSMPKKESGLTSHAAIPLKMRDFTAATVDVRNAHLAAYDADLRGKEGAEFLRKAEQTGLIEPKPDPDDPKISPGESFLSRIDLELSVEMRGFEASIRASEYGKTHPRIWLKNHMFDAITALGLKYGATPAQVQFAHTVWCPTMDTKKPPYADVRVNMAWAKAEEYIPNIRELMAEFERRIGRAVWPPDTKSPANVEALCVALGYCWSCFQLPGATEEDRVKASAVDQERNLLSNLISALSHTHDRLDLFMRKTELVYNKDGLSSFSIAWCESNFAKLEVSHKLAASLALTDIPDDVEVKAPWDTWSFIIPSGLFDKIEYDGKDPIPKSATELVEWSRAFCFGTEIAYVIYSNGHVMGPLSREKMLEKGDLQAIGKMLDSLVRGACLALSDPEQYKKKKVGSSSSGGNKREGGAPDLSSARYMLTAPVQVDLRDAVKALQRGEKTAGGKLTVQFLVRGHPRNQAYGPKLSLHKKIWIQPFWKGPEESRVLLRNYIVKDDEKGRDNDDDDADDDANGT